MRLLRWVLSCAPTLFVAGVVLAQADTSYEAPETVYGHPDLGGVWATDFMTPLERPSGIESLVVDAEEAGRIVAAMLATMPGNIDPDFAHYGSTGLARVDGEYRTSVIVDPEDGRMPFTATGLELVAWADRRFGEMFDSAEQRPLAERCLENLGYPPMRALPILLPRQIFQSRETVAILSEDAVGLRLIPLGRQPPPPPLRGWAGYASGRWEGDTLVVETTRLRADDPVRATLGRPVLVGHKTRVVERFTRVSDRELLYRFTVEDVDLYTRPWSGEFTLQRLDAPIFEYACHEGNYSMESVLLGGRRQAEERSGAGPGP